MNIITHFLKLHKQLYFLYLFYFYCVFMFVLSESSPSMINFSCSLSLSLFHKNGIPFLIPSFLRPILSFSELLLTFEVYLSVHRSHRVARLTRQLAASIQTLHLVHYEYHDFANLFGMAIFKRGNCEQHESHTRILFIIFLLLLKTNLH